MTSMFGEARLTTFDPRHNSLNALRLVFALLVIVSHAWPLGGFGPDPRLGDFTVGIWAVAGFFAISGWLVVGSALANTFRQYLWRRFLRVYPAFLVCLAVVGFGFAPLGLALGGGSYGVLDGLRYVVANSLLVMVQERVGDTPSGLPYPESWNGSLWTLALEVLCYLCLGLLVAWIARHRLPVAVLLALVVTTVVEVAIGLGVPAPYAVHLLAMLAAFFFAGAALYLFADRIPLNPVLALISAAACLGTVVSGVNGVLAAVPVAYLCIWLAVRLPLQTVGRDNDISYGVYIYAFPVQQVLALFDVQRAGLVVFVLAAVAATVPLATLSWFAVERPARRLRGNPREASRVRV